MKLPEEVTKGMNGSGWKGMALLISTTFKGKEDKHTSQLFIIDFIRFLEFKKIINVLDYEHHQTLTGKSDKETHLGLKIDEGENWKNTSGV